MAERRRANQRKRRQYFGQRTKQMKEKSIALHLNAQDLFIKKFWLCASVAFNGYALSR